MNSNASSIRPPSHPLLALVSQSTSSCSDKDTSLLVLIWFIPSTAATVEKAQQLPTKPQSLVKKFALSNHQQLMNHEDSKLTTFSLILDLSDCTLLPPINGRREVGDILVGEASFGSPVSSEQAVAMDPRPRICPPKLLRGHIPKLV